MLKAPVRSVLTALIMGILLLSGCSLFGSTPPPAEPAPPPTRSLLTARPVPAEAEQLHAKARVLWGTSDTCSDPEKAIAFLNSALEIAPDYPDALMRRGLAFAQLGHPEDAFENLTHAIRLAPTAELYAWRAQLLLTEGNYKAALKDADAALSLDPDALRAAPRAHAVRGAALLETGDTKEACAALRRAGGDVWKKALEAGVCE